MATSFIHYLKSHKTQLFAAVIASVVFDIYQTVPGVGRAINQSVVWFIPGILSLNQTVSIIIGYFLQLIPVALFCTVIVLAYYLLRIRRSLATGTGGFIANYLVIVWAQIIITPMPGMRPLDDILAFGIFYAFILLLAKKNLSPKAIIAVGAIVIIASLASTPYLTTRIAVSKALAADTASFQTAITHVPFTPYYPTYQSDKLPASAAKFNGYTKPPYSNETVSFSLGKAQVRESAVLTRQDQVMNFTTNCDIAAIQFSMETSTSITGSSLQSSLDNYKKCNLVQTTPTGKKVYFNQNGQWTEFYTLIDHTNVVITFDDINTQKYDVTLLPDILKIIDSLQPLAASHLQKGNESGFGFE